MAASVDSLSIQITASTKSAKDRVDDLCASLVRLSSAISALDTSKFETLAASATNLSTGLAGLKGSNVNQVTKMATALKNIALNDQAFESVVDKAVQGFSQMGADATKAAQGEEEIVQATQKLDATPLEDVSEALKRVSDNMGVTESKMSGFKALLAGLKIIVPTEGLDKVNKKISALSEKAQELQERLDYKSKTQEGYIDSEQMEKDQQKIEGLINEIDRLKLKKQELESHGGFKFNLQGFGNIAESISRANNKLKSFTSHLFKARSATRDTTKATNGFKEASDRLVKSLTRVTKMLKLMVTRMALRAVIKEVGNGFKSLALHSEEFDNAMSSLINASKQLGYSFAAMVAPIIQALAPALVYLINLAIKAVNVFNQLFSILTGATTWNKAKEFTGKWSDDIKAANKEAKELKKTVLGFDELNQLQDNSKSGGADTSGNIEDMFDTVNTEKKWQDFIDKLLNPLKKAWAKVGDEVMAAWKRAFENIKKLGSDIARDFWKVWEQPQTQKIFENILKIIRDIGNFVANITEQLDKAWNKNEVGLHILENIRDIIGIIVAGIQRITESWAKWAKTIDFYPLLSAVNEFLDSLKKPAEAIMGIFEDLNKDFIQPLAKWLTEEGIPELIKVFTKFNNDVQWETIRQRLDRVWKILEKFSEKVGEGLVKFIGEVADKLKNFLNSDGWDSFIDTLEHWEEKIDADDICNALEGICTALIAFKALTFLGSVAGGIKTLAGSLGGLAAVAKGAVVVLTALVGLDFGTWLGSLFDEDTYGDYRGVIGSIKLIGDTITAFKDLVVMRVDEIKKAWQNLWNTNGDVSAKGVADMVTLGAKIIEAIVNPFAQAKYLLVGDPIVIDMWNDITKVFTDSVKKIADIVIGLKDKVVEIFTGIKTKIDENINGIKTKLTECSEKFREIKEKITSYMNDVKENASKRFEDLKSNVSAFKDKWSESWDAAKRKLEDFKNNGLSILSDIKNAMSKDKWTFSGVAEGLKETFQNAKEGIKNVWNSIADTLNGEYEIGDGKLNIHLPKFYATGGFPNPEDGWFRASHGEMIGRFDNGQSVVANNQQITDGIAKAVYSAMMSAGSANNGNVPVYTTIQIGEEQIARAVTRGQRKMDRRYSPVTQS